MGHNKNTKIITVSISLNVYNMLKKRGVNISRYIEQAITFYMGYEEGKSLLGQLNNIEFKEENLDTAKLLFNIGVQERDLQKINKSIDIATKLNENDKIEFAKMIMNYVKSGRVKEGLYRHINDYFREKDGHYLEYYYTKQK